MPVKGKNYRFSGGVVDPQYSWRIARFVDQVISTIRAYKAQRSGGLVAGAPTREEQALFLHTAFAVMGNIAKAAGRSRNSKFKSPPCLWIAWG